MKTSFLKDQQQDVKQSSWLPKHEQSIAQSPLSPTQHLHQTLGNYAVGRLLTVNQPRDEYYGFRKRQYIPNPQDTPAHLVQRCSAITKYETSQQMRLNEEVEEDHCLTKSTAALIVEVVASDILCRAVIEDPVTLSLFRKIRIAGGLRNLALIIGGMDTEDPTFRRVCCIGIAENTARAIYDAGTRYSAVVRRPPKIPDVSHAIKVSRIVGGTHHHATCVLMTDGTDYVFDWHPTLDIRNPVIYQTSDWRMDKNGVDFRNFSGFF